MEPTRELEYEQENKILLDKCQRTLEVYNKSMWAQKKAAPSIKAGDDNSRDRTVRVRPELPPEPTLIEFSNWLVEFTSYYYGSKV